MGDTTAKGPTSGPLKPLKMDDKAQIYGLGLHNDKVSINNQPGCPWQWLNSQSLSYSCFMQNRETGFVVADWDESAGKAIFSICLENPAAQTYSSTLPQHNLINLYSPCYSLITSLTMSTMESCGPDPALYRTVRNLGEEVYQWDVNLGYYLTSNVTPPDVEMVFSSCPTKVIPLDDLKAEVGQRLNLGGVKESGLIRLKSEAELAFHRSDKRARFLAWFQKNGKGVLKGEGRRPHFGHSASLIRNILLTKLLPKIQEWSFYAVRIQDAIFLRSCSDNPKCMKVSGAVIFKELALGRNPKTHGLNQFEVSVDISKFSVGTRKNESHQLLVYSSGVYEDADGKRVLVRSDNEAWNREKLDESGNVLRKVDRKSERYLHFWADATSRGAEGVVMGHRDKKEELKGVDFLTLDQLWEGGGKGKEEKEKSIRFLGEVLIRVKEELPVNDPNIVKKFQATKEGTKLICDAVQDPDEFETTKARLGVDDLQQKMFDP